MPRHIVILGAGGMLGRCWAAFAAGTEGPAWRPLTSRECNILDPEAVASVVRPGVDVVINCAAFTDVDRAEREEAAAAALNGTAVGELALRCRDVGALLVHSSTDYVFAGDANAPYATDAPRAPISAYGRSKALGEQLIEDSGAEHLIVRTSWLYAPHGKNFVLTIAGLAREKPVLRVVSDQRGRPTSAEHLVRTTWRLIEAKARGVLHACDSGECTWFEFAREIAAAVNPDCRVEPCTTAEFPRPARRPAYSVLDLGKTVKIAGDIPHWRTSLAGVLTTIEEGAARPA